MKPPQAAQEQPAQSRPFTGAWIETECLTESITGLGVAPSRGRGLKRPNTLRQWRVEKGRPFTGAWIETELWIYRALEHRVAPSRGRGLKQPASDP